MLVGELDLHPGDDLAHQFGEAEREDHEIDAGNAQGRGPDQAREDRRHRRRRSATRNGNGSSSTPRPPHRCRARRTPRSPAKCNASDRKTASRPCTAPHTARCSAPAPGNSPGRTAAAVPTTPTAAPAPAAIRIFADDQPRHVGCLPKMPCGRNSSTRMNSA